MTTKCNHKNTTESEPFAYTGGVAVHPYTQQEPRAAGGICYRETCAQCKATRLVNQNRRWREYSPWRRAERHEVFRGPSVVDMLKGKP